jgi:hypothetical protein
MTEMLLTNNCTVVAQGRETTKGSWSIIQVERLKWTVTHILTPLLVALWLAGAARGALSTSCMKDLCAHFPSFWDRCFGCSLVSTYLKLKYLKLGAVDKAQQGMKFNSGLHCPKKMDSLLLL